MPTRRFLIILLITGLCVFTGYQQLVYAGAIDTTTYADAGKCKKEKEVQKIIVEAINIGAPTYNDGNHLGCYRIYEGAAYKILYEYGSKCKKIKKLLKEAVDKSHLNYSDTDRAWIMRMAFDKILGEPTITGPSKTNSL